MLYHYTTAQGFLGILREQRIRATNFSFLNDSSEAEYGLGLIAAIAEDLRLHPESGPAGFDATELIQLVKTFRLINEVYVSCFTTLRDDLSQWRGYSGIETDRYCIGFDRRELASLSADAEAYSNARLLELIYEEPAQRAAVLAAMTTSDGAARFKHELVIELAAVAARLKHPSFAAEREWRISVSVLGTGCEIADFVVVGGKLRPHITLYMPHARKLPIAEVVLLPHSSPEQARKASALALERFGYPNIVTLSTIPFVG